jgi:glycosyltransferase involved in cell wall biosynthesis
MSKLSVIIPSRGDATKQELFLGKTVDDIFNKAVGDVEVIVVLDGYWPNPPLQDHDGLVVIHRGNPMGMRPAINAAVSIAKGEYLLKCDAHCMFAPGFDQVLKSDCDDNWVVIPGRYSLDPENWAIDNNGKSRRDYHYLDFPWPDKPHDAGMHGVEWPQRSRERAGNPEYDIDDNMSFQGSCWFMHKSWFTDFLGGLHSEGYGTFSQEPQEIGNKTWLGGGAVKVNKRTWYAHLHKGSRYGRMYSMGQQEIIAGHLWSSRHWMNNDEPGMIHPMSWLVELFWPLPGWPEDRSLWVAP